MAKLRRTLLIGLGGTGFKAILNAKKMLYENYGEIPPMIGFLGIDTDRPGIESATVTAKDGTKISLSRAEQLPICVDEPREIFERNMGSKLFDWLPDANVSGLDTLKIGAGQMRSNGRFAVTVNENNVAQFVQRKLYEVNDARAIDNPDYSLLGADTEVHIVFSLGGGTGSGTFLNVAYLIKRLLPNVKISGYAVLSDVFRSMVSGAMSARVKTNGKGAIIDLDYLAHLDSASEPVEVKWFHEVDRVKERPFTALYFVDNRNDNNDMFDDVSDICEMISLAIVTSVGELGVTLDSISDNVNKLIGDGTMDIKNKKAWVAGFGCAEIVSDGDRLARIYEAKACIQLVNAMLNGGCDDPANIANSWLDNNHIRENLGKDDVIDYFMAAAPEYIYQDIDNPDNPHPEVMQYIENRAMEKPAKLNEKLDSLKARIDESLTGLMNEQANRECGIFLCNQILQSLLKQVELCDFEMKEEKERLEDEMPRRESALATACKELAECMSKFFKTGRKGYEEEVVARANEMARLRREIERRKMARLFYSWLRVRIGQSIQRVDTIMSNLAAVRSECNEDIQRYLREGAGKSFFQFDLSSDMGERIACPLEDIVFNNFAAAMKPEGGIASMSGMTSAQVREALNRFVRTMPRAVAYRSMTVDNLLDSMSDDEVKALLQRAIQKSLPLLSYSYRGWDADLKERPVETYYVGVADKRTSRLVKDNLFQNLVPGAKDVQFSEIGLSNRIIIYRQLGVVPAFTVKALDSYKTEYDKWEEDKPYGSHWDRNLCARMEKERFSLDPKVVSMNVFEVWMNAIVYDLVSYDAASGRYRIKSRGMGGRALQGWMVDMGATRCEAYQYLEDNMDVLEPEIKRALAELDVPGPDNVLRVKAAAAAAAAQSGDYLEKVSKCPISRADIYHYPAEAELIEKEIEYILDQN
ncbi:MAG: tubulin-like doman-containing protein [Muribaculaceae bacterium]|nr:tubulin-like doman-containing protein [Muribaculaceae bacterium]